jgi:hypothetical protein
MASLSCKGVVSCHVPAYFGRPSSTLMAMSLPQAFWRLPEFWIWISSPRLIPFPAPQPASSGYSLLVVRVAMVVDSQKSNAAKRTLAKAVFHSLKVSAFIRFGARVNASDHGYIGECYFPLENITHLELLVGVVSQPDVALQFAALGHGVSAAELNGDIGIEGTARVL